MHRHGHGHGKDIACNGVLARFFFLLYFEICLSCGARHHFGLGSRPMDIGTTRLRRCTYIQTAPWVLETCIWRSFLGLHTIRAVRRVEHGGGGKTWVCREIPEVDTGSAGWAAAVDCWQEYLVNDTSNQIIFARSDVLTGTATVPAESYEDAGNIACVPERTWLLPTLGISAWSDMYSDFFRKGVAPATFYVDVAPLSGVRAFKSLIIVRAFPA